jgi:DNA-binding response OmpR family regulator
MPQTIIIGANDPNIGYLLNRYAQECGFQTSQVSQADDIFDLAFQVQPAVIILDVEFADAADPELLHRIKTHSTTNNIPLIICSCLGEPPEDWHEGVDGYLLKSAKYDDFVAVLERAGSNKFSNDVQPYPQSINLS